MIESCKKDGVWDLHKLDLFVLHRCWTGSEVVQTPIFFVGHSISKTISPSKNFPEPTVRRGSLCWFVLS